MEFQEVWDRIQNAIEIFGFDVNPKARTWRERRKLEGRRSAIYIQHLLYTLNNIAEELGLDLNVK